MRILHKIDQLGVPFIEGGWPGANPRDTEFFKLATKETLQHAALTSFGMTRKAGERAEDSAVLQELLDTGTEVVCIVGKAWDLHVREALRTDLDEGVAMVRDSVAFLRGQGRRVFFDAEHFFDGYVSDPGFAMRVLLAAEEAGAERLVLCDTNGGMLPLDVARIVGDVHARVEAALGIHVHNDAGCAVANSLIAVEHGAFQVQGVVNGYGERTGNADLIPIAANLVLKMDADCLPEGAVEHLTDVAHYVAEVANVAPDSHQPYAGRYAFTHKAGLHASGDRPPGGGLRTREAVVGREPTRRGRERSRRRRHVAHEGRGVRRRDAGRRDRRDPRRAEGTRGPRVHVRGRRRVARAADAARGRMGAAVLHDRELPGPHRAAHGGRRRGRWRRRPSRSSRTAPGTSRAPRDTGRSARWTTRSARRSRTSTRRSTT